jgi:cytochrome c biogenesis protein CcdA
MIEEKQGYFLVTDTGKREFALQSTAAMSNSIMVVMGIAMVFFTFGVSFGVLPEGTVAFFGVALIVVGSLFLLLGRRNRPELTLEAKILLKELGRR